MVNDLQKTLSFLKTPNVNTKKLRSSVRVTRIEFSGRGRVTNISLSAAEHRRMFLHGAEWFVENQDPVTGGWPTPVPFNREQKKYPGAKEIQSGWYGAMCQVNTELFFKRLDLRHLSIFCISRGRQYQSSSELIWKPKMTDS